MNYCDIQSYANSDEIITLRHQMCREQNHLKEKGLIGEKYFIKGNKLSKESEDIVEKICKDLFKYTPEEGEVLYARC